MFHLTDSSVIVGTDEIFLGENIRITSKKDALLKMYVLSEVLGISVERFYDHLKQEKRLKARESQLKEPRNYIANINIDLDKDLITWVIELIFEVPESNGRRVVLKRLLSMNEIKKINEYLKPFIPKLRQGNSRIEQLTGILCTTFNS